MRVLANLIVLAMVATGPPAAVGSPERDWANLAGYHRANLSLAKRPDPRRVVFMGDSVTLAWTRDPLFRANTSFVGRGIGGQTALQMLARFRSDVIQLRPAVVHIMAGTNDIAQNLGPETQEQALGYIAGMTELAHAHGVKVVIGSVPPTADFPWRRGMAPAAKIRQFNGKLAAYAASQGATYADYWSVLAASDGAMRRQYSSDGLHPNAAGYAAMRPVAVAALAQAMPPTMGSAVNLR